MTAEPDRLPSVLLVDDEARVLSALERALRREGWAIRTAESPREALRILEEDSVDLVLSDHKMPGMTGAQFLEVVRSRYPHTVRLLLTGWAEALSAEEMEAAGIEKVISKPWDDAELRALLRTHLRSPESL
ncbi:MAG: response regulator [Myxococcota bacterium]